MSRRETGIFGEKLAGDFLSRNGYNIVETNYRCRQGEVDIIAWQQDTLVFIEVRTRRSPGFGSPEESITEVKKLRMQEVAAQYCQEMPEPPESWRIDVVAIQMDERGKVSRLELIENAVEEFC